MLSSREYELVWRRAGNQVTFQEYSKDKTLISSSGLLYDKVAAAMNLPPKRQLLKECEYADDYVNFYVLSKAEGDNLTIHVDEGWPSYGQFVERTPKTLIFEQLIKL